MAYNDKELKRDVRNIPIPQYWDEDANDYAPLDNGMNIKEAQVMIPTEQQAAYSKTVVAYGPSPIPANTYVTGSGYIDCDGFRTIAVSVNMTGGTGMNFTIDWSHDGTSYFANPQAVAYDGSSQAAAAEMPVLARYARIGIKNKDASNVKTTTAYFMLKV